VKYVLLANQNIPAGAGLADLTVTGVNWVASAAINAKPDITVENVATQIPSAPPANASGTAGGSTRTSNIVVVGQVTDADTTPFRTVLIVAVLKDAQGNPVGASQTVIDSIASNETKNFSITYPATVGVNPAATEVNAYAPR